MPAAALTRVLIVDDDSAMRDLIQVALVEIGGLSALACGSGSEALSRAPAFRPDLVLADMQLPDTDGAALAVGMQTLPMLDGVPTVILTGRPEVVRRSLSPEGPVIGVLGKPFDPLNLARDLNALMVAWSDSGTSGGGERPT
jgi:CheY-like chemotaxis protein